MNLTNVYDPQAKMLLISPEFSCSNEVIHIFVFLKSLSATFKQFSSTCQMLSIVAMVSSQNIFMRPKEAAKAADEAKAQFAHEDGDHLSLLNAYYAYKQSGDSKDWCYENFLNYRSLQGADSVREQLARIMKKLGLPLISTDFSNPEYYNNIRKCLVGGLFMQAAHLQKQGHYLTCKDHQVVAIHPSSVIDSKPPWVIFQDFVLTTRNFIRSVTVVRLEWLAEQAPHYFDLETWPEGETKAELEKCYRRIMQERAYASGKKAK